MPAEWEKQSAVQLTWPNEHTDWAPMLSEITAVYEEMAREISKREPLIIVDDIPHNDTWARDHGFITCLTPNPSPIGEGNYKGEGSVVPAMEFIANGDRCVVRKVRNVHEQYGFHFAEVTMTFPDYDDYELTALVMLDTLTSEAPALTREQQEQLYQAVMEQDMLL